MKIALIGDGKTGKHVAEILKTTQHEMTVFNLQNPPTSKNLIHLDVIINFTPGDAFLQNIPLFLASAIPVVSGSTGISLPKDLDLEIKKQESKWIYASNFSLGMILVNNMLKELSHARDIFSNYTFNLNETHHTKKLDNPSGTALSWAAILGGKVNIKGHREGDVVGIHEVELDTNFENITLKHTAKDRKIFAHGAIWAAEKLVNEKSISPGLHFFQEIVSQFFTNQIGVK